MDLAHYWFQAPAGGGGYQVGNSLRFRGGPFLSRTLASSVSTAWSMSAWVKIAKTDASGCILTTGQRGLEHSAEKLRDGQSTLSGPGLHRDPSAWYHCLLTATSTGNETLYVNGVQQFSGTGWAALSGAIAVGTAAWSTGTSPFNGYLAEVHFVDGQVLQPTSFGEFNADGVWIPIDVTGLTYGQNGFYLDFSDPADIGADRSGNGNNFTPTGFELTDTTSRNYDWVADSPTDNFSTHNPLDKSGNFDNKLANLDHSRGTTSGNANGRVTQFVSSGKHYWEFTTMESVAADAMSYGIATNAHPMNGAVLGSDAYSWAYQSNGQKRHNNTSSAYGSGWPSNLYGGHIIGVALDMDAGTVEFYLDGVSQGQAFSGITEPVSPAVWINNTNARGNGSFNTGNRPFAHTPPAGFKALSTAGLPAVAITNPSEHFQTLLSDDAKTPEPAAIGEAYGGGFYAGRINDAGKVYNLIVAPVTEGALEGQVGGATPSQVQWKTSGNGPDTTAQSEVYGATATLANSTTTHPIFNWCVANAIGPNAGTYDATNTAGTGIGGRNDWYIPAKNELEILYRNLKPNTSKNNTTGSPGSNPNAVPPTGPYTAGNPVQTTAAIFRAGGAQAFATSNYYWPATELSGDPTGAGRYGFDDGAIGGNVKIVNLYARAIRREFAYDAGLLDLAQAKFPNGLWWIKDRANTNQHQLVDSVRGGNLAFTSPATNAEQAYAAPSGNSVAWCWDLVTDRSNGFDIVAYTGNGTNQTIAHSLGVAPEFILVAARNTSQSIFAGSTYVDNWTRKGTLNSDAKWDGTPAWNNTPPTSTVFSVGASAVANGSGTNYVAYLWRSVPGYSSIGSYVGTGNRDAAFVYTGFRPAFLLTKLSTTAGDWQIRDSARGTYNPVSNALIPNQTLGENAASSIYEIDLLSNGFKIRGDMAAINASGQTILYIAFAEHPFGGSNVSPSPAR